MTRPLVAAALVLAVLVVLATIFGSIAIGPVRVLALERGVEGRDTTVALRPGPGLAAAGVVFASGCWVCRVIQTRTRGRQLRAPASRTGTRSA